MKSGARPSVQLSNIGAFGYARRQIVIGRSVELWSYRMGAGCLVVMNACGDMSPHGLYIRWYSTDYDGDR